MLCVVVGCRRSSQEEGGEFPALEVLHLSDNRLTSGVFWSIKNLKRSFFGTSNLAFFPFFLMVSFICYFILQTQEFKPSGKLHL